MYDPNDRAERAFITRDFIQVSDGRKERLPAISHIRDNIYQGGALEQGIPLPKRFQHVVNLFGIGYFTEGHQPITSMVVDMADSHDQDMSMVDTLANWVSTLAESGPVLVHCQAGLNRSGVVVARTLMLKYGLSADEAIEEVRSRRAQIVLCNPMFEDWLRSRA